MISTVAAGRARFGLTAAKVIANITGLPLSSIPHADYDQPRWKS